MFNSKHLHLPRRLVLLIIALTLSTSYIAVRAADNSDRIFIPNVVVAPTATPPTPPGPHTPPKYSTSYYMDSIDPLVAYSYGCSLGNIDEGIPGKQEQLVVLDYGSPKVRYGEFGVSAMWRYGFATMAQVYESARMFGYGYWDCADSDFASHLTIAVGTSNYSQVQHGVVYPSVSYGHGQAFAQMVNNLQYWFSSTCTRGCDGQVDVVGASDIELSWGTYSKTIDWVNGYDSANFLPLYNFGALEGCPRLSAPGANCANGWTKDQVMQITTGFIYPVPEVYATNGVNAQQWYLMSLYAAQTRGKPFDFAAVMTTWQACQQTGGCSGIDNTPSAGWLQLNNLVNKDVRTYDSIPFSTDIKWLDEGTVAPSSLDPAGHPDKVASEIGALKPVQIEIEEGIFEGSAGLLRPSMASIRNGWEGVRGGVALRVLAGSEVEDARQGLLVVINPQGSDQPGPHFYSAPQGSGALRILEMQDTAVVLETETGEQILFDLTTRTYR